MIGPNTDLPRLESEIVPALMALDLDWAREWLPGGHQARTEALLASMHKTRYELADFPAEVRHASGHWLRENGFRRATGAELLPEGVLPCRMTGGAQ